MCLSPLALELVGPHLDLISSPSPLVYFFFFFPFVSAETQTHPSNHPRARTEYPRPPILGGKILMPSSSELTVIHQGSVGPTIKNLFLFCFFFVSLFPARNFTSDRHWSVGGKPRALPAAPGQISDHTAEFGALRLHQLCIGQEKEVEVRTNERNACPPFRSSLLFHCRRC